MSGRRLFFLVAPLLRFVIVGLKLLPICVRVSLLELFKYFPFRLGVALRYVLAASIFRRIGTNVYIAAGVTFKNAQYLSVGSNVSFHDNVYVDALGEIIIGDDVSIAHQASLVSFNHTWDNRNKPIKYNSIECGPINIADDVWVSCGVRILAGASISERTVVAAGAVVVAAEFPPLVLIGGIPAKTLKAIPYVDV